MVEHFQRARVGARNYEQSERLAILQAAATLLSGRPELQPKEAVRLARELHAEIEGPDDETSEVSDH